MFKNNNLTVYQQIVFMDTMNNFYSNENYARRLLAFEVEPEIIEKLTGINEDRQDELSEKNVEAENRAVKFIRESQNLLKELEDEGADVIMLGGGTDLYSVFRDCLNVSLVEYEFMNRSKR